MKMIFRKQHLAETWGKRAGYLFAYFLFTTLLYFILLLLHKLPVRWNYIHIMIVTLMVTLTGAIIKRLLK